MGKRHNHALRFVLLLGVISLFADMTYEFWINFRKQNRRYPYDVSQHPVR